MVSSQDILRISSYFTKKYHTPGRLRVNIKKSIVDEVKDISLDDITSLPNQIDGLKDVKVNKIMATATILYDANIFKPQLWEDLIDGKNLDEVVVLLNDLQKNIKEIR